MSQQGPATEREIQIGRRLCVWPDNPSPSNEPCKDAPCPTCLKHIREGGYDDVAQVALLVDQNFDVRPEQALMERSVDLAMRLIGAI